MTTKTTITRNGTKYTKVGGESLLVRAQGASYLSRAVEVERFEVGREAARLSRVKAATLIEVMDLGWIAADGSCSALRRSVYRRTPTGWRHLSGSRILALDEGA